MDKTIDALGFIEVRGLVAGIEAADAMLKSAQVRLLRQHCVHPGLISLVVEGDLAACRAAVNAGVAAAQRVGTVISSNLIGRPDTDTETLIVDMLAPEKPGNAKTKLAGKASAKPVSKAAAPAKPDPKPAKTGPEPAASAEKKTAKPAGTGESDAVKPVLEFIGKTERGRSWKEITNQFPKLPQRVRKELDALVTSGKLVKVGARYRNAAPKES